MQSPVFVGRREEIASLTALLERAAAAEPGFAIVAGEAGVGKTRLVTELAGRAVGSGFTVLAGHCVELGAEGLPLAPLIDALRTLARISTPDELAEVLGPARRGLGRSCPNSTRAGRPNRPRKGFRCPSSSSWSSACWAGSAPGGRGDLDGARRITAAGLVDYAGAMSGRYVWPVLWLATRTEAEGATRARDRREGIPDGTAARYQELALLAADLPAPSAASRGYRALVTAELMRATGEAGVAAWQAAVEDPLARFGLTEREREIVVLLAAGRSNPQIAEALYISPKTASVHVSNILAKLGVDSRVEAAAVAHRLGVTG